MGSGRALVIRIHNLHTVILGFKYQKSQGKSMVATERAFDLNPLLSSITKSPLPRPGNNNVE